MFDIHVSLGIKGLIGLFQVLLRNADDSFFFSFFINLRNINKIINPIETSDKASEIKYFNLNFMI